MLPSLLYLNKPLRFGKHKGKSPLEIWTGSKGEITPSMKASLNSFMKYKTKHNGKKVMHSKLVKKGIITHFVFPHSSKLDEIPEVLNEMVSFILTHRGDPTYIEWLISNTQYFFHPAELKTLKSKKSFRHKDIRAVFVGDSGEEVELPFDFIPSKALYKAKLKKGLKRRNKEKYKTAVNAMEFERDDIEDYTTIDSDNPFGVDSDEAETIYWNTH